MESAKTLAKAGVMHTPVMEPTLNFQQAPNSYQVGKPNGNAAIVFGADRPATLASGWGARGANRCNAIDIVVGRMSSARGGDGNTPTLHMHEPGPRAACMLPSWVADVIASGTEDGPQLERAVPALQLSPLIDGRSRSSMAPA